MVLLQIKCVLKHDGQGKAALNASWSFIKQVGWFIFTLDRIVMNIVKVLVADYSLSRH